MLFKAIAFLAATLAASFSFAAPVTWNVTGSVSTIDSELAPYFSPSDILILKFSYESSSPPLYGNPWSQAYATDSFQLTVGSNPFTPVAANATVTVGHDTTSDQFGILNQVVNGLNVPGLGVPTFNFVLVDSTASTFSDTSLPTNLGGLTLGFMSLAYENSAENRSVQVRFNVDSIGVNSNQVPEPTVAGLLGLGLVGLAFSRRKRRYGTPN
jgi:hypothetical protein